jgi:hypothetical protein
MMVSQVRLQVSVRRTGLVTFGPTGLTLGAAP